MSSYAVLAADGYLGMVEWEAAKVTGIYREHDVICGVGLANGPVDWEAGLEEVYSGL